MIKEVKLINLDAIKLICNIYTNNLINIDNIKNDLSINPFSRYVIYIENDEVVAFVNYLIMYEKMEIVNIVVKEQFRQMGIASMMMEYIINTGTKNGCENITLEVRKSNIAAINLYQKYGFKKVATRENYYDNEDGILMEKRW